MEKKIWLLKKKKKKHLYLTYSVQWNEKIFTSSESDIESEKKVKDHYSRPCFKDLTRVEYLMQCQTNGDPWMMIK